MESKRIYIYARWDSLDKKFAYSVRPYTVESELLLEEREIFFETPSDFELRKQVSLVLKAKRNKVIADAQVEALEIDQEIQELLAIEDKS